MAMPPVMKSKQKSMKKGSTIPNMGKSGQMLKGQHTGTQTPGVSSQEKKASGGNGAKGGNTKMFGFAPSVAAKPGKSSAR